MTKDTAIGEVIANPALGDFGRLLFPVNRAVTEDMTLAQAIVYIYDHADELQVASGDCSLWGGSSWMVCLTVLGKRRLGASL